MTALLVLFRRELALAWAGGGGPLLACGFFLCLTVLVPLAAGGDPAGLKPVAGGIAWLALALSSILSLERLFERDLEDVPAQRLRMLEVVAQGLHVRDEDELLALPLKLYAPLQRADVMPEMKRAGGAVPGQDPVFHGSIRPPWCRKPPILPMDAG